MLLLQPYLELSLFTIRTDHVALKLLVTSAESSSKLAVWRLRLDKFDFEVVRHAFIKHQAPDALLMLNKKESDTISLDRELPGLMINDSEEQEDLVLETFDQDQPDNEVSGNSLGY